VLWLNVCIYVGCRSRWVTSPGRSLGDKEGCMKNMINFEAHAGTSAQENIEPAMDCLGDL
jgi:hypothetical protein